MTNSSLRSHSQGGVIASRLVHNPLDGLLIAPSLMQFVHICKDLGISTPVIIRHASTRRLQRENHQEIRSTELAAQISPVFRRRRKLRFKEIEVVLEVGVEEGGVDCVCDAGGDWFDEEGHRCVFDVYAG
jgi:hypothetical protein